VEARRIASTVLAVLAAVCVVGALVGGYARVALLDSNQFADRATAALHEEPVRDVIAREVTDQAVLRADRDLVAIRPLIETAASAIMGSRAFEGLFSRAVRDLHRTAFTRDQNTVTLTIADVGVLLSTALHQLDPKASARLPHGLDAKLNAGAAATDALDVAQVADRIKGFAFVFAGLAVLLLVAAVLVAPRRRHGVVQAGIAVAAAGALVVLAYQVARAVLLARFSVPEDHAAADAVWKAFLADLQTWAVVTMAAGTIAAAAAASLLQPVDVGRPLRRAWRVVVTVPAAPARRVGRALALIAAGVLIIAERDRVLAAALVLAGVFVLYQGVQELLRMVAEAPAARPAHADRPRRRRRPAVGPVLAGTVAAALVALLVAGLIAGGGTEASAGTSITACNGHAQLCDRRLNEVAFPGTHNAMSAMTNANWLFAQQERDMAGQLDDGVRALLIDGHYGERVGSHVRTDVDVREQRAELEQQLGKPAVQAALRIRDRILGRRDAGPKTTWLCHGFCELGALDLTKGLGQVRDFLVAHPNEVLIVVVQDEGVTPDDVAKAVERSGVRPFVYTGPAGPPWPTLRQMIESGGRVVVMAENQGGGDRIPWYHEAYKLMQETPYHFTKPAQFSCAANRGPRDASLFLLNHWIDTSPAPKPSNAAKVNAYDPLLGRARQCRRERGLLPNVVAVDFYATGDLFRVVDTLNGVGGGR
jgi:hypothetical protein